MEPIGPSLRTNRLHLNRIFRIFKAVAYSSSEVIRNANDEGRELRGPAPASPDRGKVFPIEAFDAHVEERCALTFYGLFLTVAS